MTRTPQRRTVHRFKRATAHLFGVRTDEVYLLVLAIILALGLVALGVLTARSNP